MSAEHPVSPPSTPRPEAEIAVVGGSGLSSLDAEDARALPPVHTPYGTVDGITAATIAGRRVVFLPRHGAGHRVPPHALNVRAQLWALASLGAGILLSTNAVGGLDPAANPGDLLLTDQLIDRTWGRADTFFDDGAGEPGVQHLPFAEPYSRQLRAIAASALRGIGETPHDAGTSVVIQGPRFSTRAEGAWHRLMGASTVNMTQLPEAALAAELGFAHVNLAIITDTDTEHGDGEDDRSVSADRVFQVMAAAQPRLAAAITAIIAAIPAGFSEEPALPAEVVRSILDRPTSPAGDGGDAA